MRIVFITDNFPPEVNAPASRTYEHAREWVRAGHTVQVITCAPNFPFGTPYPGYRNALYTRERLDGIDVLRVWSYMTRNEGFWLRSLDFLSFMITSVLGSLFVARADVVIATSPQFFAGVAGYLVARLTRAPFVLEVRDLWPDQIVANQVMASNPAIRLLRGVARFLYDHADAVVTVGEGYEERIRARYGVRRPIDVIPNGVIASVFQRSGARDAVRDAHGWAGRFVVLYLGTHGLSQKLETVVEAAALLERDERFHFVFVGDGAAREQIAQQVRAKGLSHVELLGQRPKAEVPDLYEAADCCVVPLKRSALYAGNYPSKMFEAMAMACPIVLSVEGIAADLLRRADAGLAVPAESPQDLAEAIRRLVDDPERALQMGRNGRAFVCEHFSRERWAARLLAVLERVRRSPGG